MPNKLKLDLHPIYNKGSEIDQALNDAIQQVLNERIKILEIIPGKGSGQLKNRVLKFLDQKHIKRLYQRIDKDAKNHGRIFVWFKF
jgi:DNA-nicking Smr family endonuclease